MQDIFANDAASQPGHLCLFGLLGIQPSWTNSVNSLGLRPFHYL